MLKNITFEAALELMLEKVGAVDAERIELTCALGRVLAKDVYAVTDVPPFDRSPYDGYALRADDTQGAGREAPARLKIIEEIPAGSFPQKEITAGTAAKILTGGPVPKGADAIVKYELTEFDDQWVQIFEPITRHDIVPAGEDMKKGACIAQCGDVVEPALLGTFAAQGITELEVFRRPRVGIISTGDELVEPSEGISGGKIRNSNRYVLEGAVRLLGMEPVILGTAQDTAEAIAALIEKGLEVCDVILSTGGVSVGDYDATPAAMERAGAQVLVHRLAVKPGGACAYGERDGKIIFGLSGNPAASMINYYLIAQPCLRKLSGMREYLNKATVVTLAEDFGKASPYVRIIRGRTDISDGRVMMRIAQQGSGAVHSLIDCGALAIVPEGVPGLSAGTQLKAYLI